MNAKRTFTKQQKLSILKEAAESGVNATLEKHVFTQQHTIAGARNSKKWEKKVRFDNK